METHTNVLDKIRKFGGYMSGMVMPNLGAFVGWGLLAALFIPTGWIPNERLNEMVSPILNYLLPLLIGYTAGYNIHGQRGGVIGAFITITVIKGTEALGPARAAMLIVLAQLTVSYLAELAGLFGVEKQPFEWRKLIGLAVAGIVVFKWK